MYPILFEIGPVTIYSFGLMAAIGFFVSGILIEKELVRHGRNKELASSIIIAALIGGVAGAKIYFLIENYQLVEHDFFGSVFSGAGLVWYGGLIGGFLTVTWYIHHKNIPFLLAGDIIGPVILLGQGFGRIGCFLAGDGDYGPPTDVPWAMAFPDGVVPTAEPVHPTPVYDFVLLFSLFFILWSLRKKGFKQGTMFGLFAIAMGAERFFTEFWRTDPNVLFDTFSTAQVISFFLFLTGIGLVYYINRIKKD